MAGSCEEIITGLQRPAGMRPALEESRTPQAASQTQPASGIIRTLLSLRPSCKRNGPIHLHHESRLQGGAAETHHPAGYLLVVFSWREDRRTWFEWIGQVEPAADH